MNYKIEAGQGGRKGHSNMSHHNQTEVIKKRNKKLRRQYGKNLCKICKEEA